MATEHIILAQHVTGEMADEIIKAVRKIDKNAYLEIKYIVTTQVQKTTWHLEKERNARF